MSVVQQIDSEAPVITAFNHSAFVNQEGAISPYSIDFHSFFLSNLSGGFSYHRSRVGGIPNEHFSKTQRLPWQNSLLSESKCFFYTKFQVQRLQKNRLTSLIG